MKVIYEFEPDPEKNMDQYKLELMQFAEDMYSSLSDIDNLVRNLRKGYVYYPPESEEELKDDKYALIDIDKLIDDLSDILSESKYYDFH